MAGIKIGKDGSITRDGKTYKNKAEYSSAMKKQRADKKANPSPKWWEGRKAKEKRAEKASVAQGKRNQAASDTMKAAEKKYAKESMFAKAADNRDKAKTTPGKARPFGEAKDAAEKAGKDRFLWKGKSYFTTKGAADNRDKKKTEIGKKGSMSGAKPTGFGKPTKSKKKLFSKLNEKIKSFRKKIGGYSTQAEYESARDKRRIEKRIAKMKERKNQGKSYSAKNLAELEAKLK